MSITVSVIMPVYNGAVFLDKAIASVLEQTLTDFELIIVDDCSKDNSFEKLNEWAGKDHRIKLFKNDRNLGIFGTLNRMVDLAQSDLIKIFCQDDLMMANCLDRQVGYMQKHAELGFSRCLGTQEIKPQPRPKGPYRYMEQLPEIIMPQASALAFFTFGNIPGNLTNLIFRKKVVEACGPFDQSYPYAGDFEMWVRVARKYPFGLQREALVYVHSHTGQGSVTLNKHNELIVQLNVIMSGLFIHISDKHRSICRYHASVTVVVQQASSTLRRLFEGNIKAFSKYWVYRSFAYPSIFCLALYVVTLGMRFGSKFSSHRLLLAINSGNNRDA
jgi:glycosyltransferase involved in cell wall biosynthesis